MHLLIAAVASTGLLASSAVTAPAYWQDSIDGSVRVSADRQSIRVCDRGGDLRRASAHYVVDYHLYQWDYTLEPASGACESDSTSGKITKLRFSGGPTVHL